MALTHEALIRYLSDGQFHSGSELGQLLDVSRAAVWKRLQQLSTFGLDVLALKGKGYRLTQPIEFLDEVKILQSLNSSLGSSIAALDVKFSVKSTSDEVLNFSLDENKEGVYICLAEYQEAGRGRRGRQWVSPLGGNIYLSMLCQFHQGAAVLNGLSLAIATTVIDSLKAYNIPKLGLKWPNDILLDGKKMGGILLDVKGDPTGACQLAIGLGLNIRMPVGDLCIDQAWSSLGNVVDNISRNELAANLIGRLIPLLKTYPEDGFSAYRKAWELADVYAGKKVSVLLPKGVRQEGRARGVSDDGALLVDVDGCISTFYSGEVSLRLNEGLSRDT